MNITECKKALIATLNHNESLSKGDTDQTRIVPYIVGMQGLGKTASAYQACLETKRGFFSLVVAQVDPTELGGQRIPSQDRKSVHVAMPDWKVAINKQIEQGFEKGILFLDELPQAPTAVLNVCRQLVNERRVGEHHLPDGWSVVCAGNRLQDKAGVNRLPSHLKDCLTYFNIEPNREATCNYMATKKCDFKVIAYLRAREQFYCVNDPSQDSNPTPRSWERVANILRFNFSDLFSSADIPHILRELISGQVGEPAMKDFTAFLKIIKNVPEFMNLDNLINNPTTAKIPEQPDVLYALIGAVAGKANNSNMKNIITYIDRIPQKEYAGIAIMDIVRQNKEMKKNKDLLSWLRNSNKDGSQNMDLFV